MIRRLISIGLAACVASAPAGAFAQGLPATPNGAECLSDLYDAFGREHRLERAVLFGRPKAKDAALTSVFYDFDGDPWVKTGTNEWTSPSDEFDGETWSDDDMDKKSESDLLCQNNSAEIQRSCVKLPRRGVFEIRKTPTSDLIQPIVQSVRALQCRLRAICALAAESPSRKSGEKVTITLDGCLPMTFPVMEGCIDPSPTFLEAMPGLCLEARKQLVEREMQVLMLTSSYDASYRSLAQFAGMFQEFLVQFRFPIIEPIWQMVRMLGGLKEIPCFSSECNE